MDIVTNSQLGSQFLFFVFDIGIVKRLMTAIKKMASVSKAFGIEEQDLEAVNCNFLRSSWKGTERERSNQKYLFFFGKLW